MLLPGMQGFPLLFHFLFYFHVSGRCGYPLGLSTCHYFAFGNRQGYRVDLTGIANIAKYFWSMLQSNAE